MRTANKKNSELCKTQTTVLISLRELKKPFAEIESMQLKIDSICYYFYNFFNIR